MKVYTIVKYIDATTTKYWNKKQWSNMPVFITNKKQVRNYLESIYFKHAVNKDDTVLVITAESNTMKVQEQYGVEEFIDMVKKENARKNQKTVSFFKVRPKAGSRFATSPRLFAVAGMSPIKFSKVGKTWSASGHVRLFLNGLTSTDLVEVEVIEVTVPANFSTTGTVVIHDAYKFKTASV